MGYPHDPWYRDFHRDIGFDLPEAALHPFASGDPRTATGLKYHRGQCVYEKGYYTFVGPTVAAGMRRKIELGLLALTGRRFRAMVRKGAVQEAKQKSSAELPT